MPPVRPVRVVPPLKVIIECDGAFGWGEYNRARDQILRRRPWEIFRPGSARRDRYAARVLREPSKLFVGNFGLVHPVRIDVHRVPWLGVRHVQFMY